MHTRFGLLAALVFIGAATPMHGQLTVKRGSVVIFKLPLNTMNRDVKTPFGRNAYTVYSALIESDGDAVAVNGNSDWKTSGFPSMLALKVDKIKEDARKGQTVVELKLGDDWRFDLTLRGDVNRLFQAVTTDNASSKSYLAEAYDALANKLLTGPLQALSAEKKRELLVFAHVTAQGASIATAKYKDHYYLTVDLGVDPLTYNDLKLNGSQRISMVVREKLLTLIKSFAKPVEGATDVYGVKLTIQVPHKNLAEEYATPGIDNLELFAPSSLVRKFADADITSQQLIDGCIVLVNNNRVQVQLAGP